MTAAILGACQVVMRHIAKYSPWRPASGFCKLTIMRTSMRKWQESVITTPNGS